MHTVKYRDLTVYRELCKTAVTMINTEE